MGQETYKEEFKKLKKNCNKNYLPYLNCLTMQHLNKNYFLLFLVKKYITYNKYLYH